MKVAKMFRQFVSDKSRAVVAIAAAMVFLATGCSSGNKAEQILKSMNKDNIHRLANLYNLYQSQHSWVGPADIDEFKEFVNGVSKSRLEKMGIDPSSLDDLFISERDGQEFVIRPSVQGSAMGSVQPVVFEKDGVDGVWLVGFTSKGSREVTSRDEYDQMFNGTWQEVTSERKDGPGAGN